MQRMASNLRLVLCIPNRSTRQTHGAANEIFVLWPERVPAMTVWLERRLENRAQTHITSAYISTQVGVMLW